MILSRIVLDSHHSHDLSILDSVVFLEYFELRNLWMALYSVTLLSETIRINEVNLTMILLSGEELPIVHSGHIRTLENGYREMH